MFIKKIPIVLAAGTLVFLVSNGSQAQDCSYEISQNSETACCAVCKEIAKDEKVGNLTGADLRAAVNCIDHVYFRKTADAAKFEALSFTTPVQEAVADPWNWKHEVSGSFSPAFPQKVEALFAGMFGNDGLDATIGLSPPRHTHLMCRVLYKEVKGPCEYVFGVGNKACS